MINITPEEAREAVEIGKDIKLHIDNATLGFSGFTAKQAVTFDKILFIAQAYASGELIEARNDQGIEMWQPPQEKDNQND